MDHEHNGNYQYCPKWSAPNKGGKPKKSERRKSVLEEALGKRVAKKTKRLTCFCQVCHRISHPTNDCWELEKNVHLQPSEWQSAMEEMEGARDTANVAGVDKEEVEGGVGTAE